MKPIVVATDFSPAAWNAAQYAADMARSTNGYVVLLHVCEVPLAVSEVPVITDVQAMISEAKKAMDETERKLEHYSHEKLIIDSYVRTGNFFAELTAFCKEIKPYTVVIGSQGKTGAERLMFGGHAINAMKYLEWPIIAVPPHAKFSSIKKIGLACDLSDVMATVPIDEIKALVNEFEATLHVLNTGKKDRFDPEMVFQSGLMQEMLFRLNPIYNFITHDNVDRGIIEFAEKNDIDLLLVLPKRHGLVERLMHTSHTRQLILHSHIPVMALHHSAEV